MRFRKTPTSDELNQELKREQYKTKYRRTLTSTVFVLITAAAAAVLVATLWLPVLRIYGPGKNYLKPGGSLAYTLQECVG